MKRFLHHQKTVFALLLAFSLGMGTTWAYDFSAVCSSGQTLYYNIIDATNHYVEITYPGTSTNPWGGFAKPTGNIILPTRVTYDGVTYTVTAIGNKAFYSCTGLTGSLTIPDSVTTIGSAAFHQCRGITSDVVQTIALSEGWNWWSTYIEIDGSEALGMLEEGLGENGISIKSQNAYVGYDGQAGWTGTLSSINNESGYKIWVAQDCNFQMSGDLALPANHPITLNRTGTGSVTRSPQPKASLPPCRALCPKWATWSRARTVSPLMNRVLAGPPTRSC